MNRGLLYRLLICICSLAVFLYSSIDKQNEITELEMCIPTLATEVKEVEEQNAQLGYEIDQLEHPKRLLSLLKKKEFSHLVYPDERAVIYVQDD